MKRLLLYGITLIVAVLILILLFSRITPVASEVDARVNFGSKIVDFPEDVFIKKLTFDKYYKYRDNMRICESTNDPSAVNLVDVDGTPSIGLYQFKTGTFKYYIEKYDLFDGHWRSWDAADWYNNIRSRVHQEEVFNEMIKDPDVVWEREFPDCVREYGKPKVVIAT